MNFIMTKDINVANNLRKIGFMEVPSTGEQYLFSYDQLLFTSEVLDKDWYNKIVLTNHFMLQKEVNYDKENFNN